MNARQMTFPLPGNRPAVLSLPQTLPPEALVELEHSLTAALRLVIDATACVPLRYVTAMRARGAMPLILPSGAGVPVIVTLLLPPAVVAVCVPWPP